MKLPLFLLAPLIASQIHADLTPTPAGPYDIGLGFGQSSELALTVANDGTSAENTGVFFQGSIGSSLEDSRTVLDENSADFLALLPDRYSFGGGETGTSISDGGGDMYDGGNILRFGGDTAPVLPYSNDTVMSAGEGEISYFTRKYDGLFVLAADYGSSSSFHINGDLGADGSGSVQTYEFDPGQGYRAYVKSVTGAGDPSVNHLILVPNDPDLSRSSPTSTNADLHSISGLPSDGRIYFLLFAKQAGASFARNAVEELATSFLRTVRPGPSWISWERNVSAPAGGSSNFSLLLQSEGLEAGTYETKFALAPEGSDPTSIPADRFQDLSLTVDSPTFTVASNSLEIGAIIGAPIDPVRVDLLPGTGFTNFDDLEITTDDSWLNVSRVTGENAILISPETVGGSAAEIVLTSGGTRQVVSLKFILAPLNLIQVLPDPTRQRLYAINQAGMGQGSVLVFDTSNQSVIKNIPVGMEPTDLALTEDSAELLVMNTTNPSITRINLDSLEVSDTDPLAEFSNRNGEFGGHVVDGPGDIIYYIDEQWGPRLRVFNTSTQTVLQTFGAASDNSNNLGNDFGFGDIQINPDRTELFGWRQYGDGAGVGGSNIVRFEINPDGTLSGHAVGPNASSENFDRDPYDSPVIFSADGSQLIVKDSLINQNTLQFEGRFPDEIYAISPNGRLGSGANEFYSVLENEVLFTLPTRSPVQAFLPDQTRFVYFANGELQWLDLVEELGFEALGIEITPALNATVTSPDRFEWLPIVGATSYQLYLGSSEAEAEVAAAGPDDPEFVGTSTTTTLSFARNLAAGSYFWKVVPNHSPDPQSYSFSVAQFETSVAEIDLRTLERIPNIPGSFSITSTQAASWSATSSESWLTITRSEGSVDDSIVYAVSTVGLDPGRYTAVISVALEGQTIEVPFTLRVDALNFTLAEGDLEDGMIYLISEVADDRASGAYLVSFDSETDLIIEAVRCGSDVTDFAIHYPENRIYLTNHQLGKLLAYNRTTLELEQTYLLETPGNFSDLDPFKVAAGRSGEVMIEAEDQWIDIALLDTSDGSEKGRRFERQGGGVFSPDGLLYYHGDSNSSGAVLSRHDTTTTDLTELNSFRTSAFSYYGSRTVNRSGDGSRVYWNGGIFDPELNLLLELAEGEVLSSTFFGDLVVTATQIINSRNGEILASLPQTATVQAISQNQEKLYLFDGAEIIVVDLTEIATLPPVELTPSIADDAIIVGTDHEISWSFSASALGYDVYLGTDPDALMAADKESDLFVGSTTDPTLEGGFSGLTIGTTYFWRIDSRGLNSTNKGEVWTFRIAPIEISEQDIHIDAPLGAPVPDQALVLGLAGETQGWTAASENPRITLDRESGASGDTLTISLDTSGAVAGFYQSSISLTTAGETFDFPFSYQLYELDIRLLHPAPDAASVLALSHTPPLDGPSFILEVEAASGDISRFIEAGRNALDFDLSDDATTLYLANEGEETSLTIDLADWSPSGELALGSNISRVQATPDGLLIAEGSGSFNEDGLFDPETNAFLNRTNLPNQELRKVGMSPDGKTYYVSVGQGALAGYNIFENQFSGSANFNFNIPAANSNGNLSLLIVGDEPRFFLSNKVLNADHKLVAVLPNIAVATDQEGTIAVGPEALYWSLSGEMIETLPFSSLQAIVSSDDRHLIRFNDETARFVSTPFSSDGPVPQPGQELSESPALISIPEVPDAGTYELFLGTSADSLEQVDSGNDSSFEIGAPGLSYGRYFWRIDAIGADGTTTGEVHSFSVLLSPDFVEMANNISKVVAQEGNLLGGTNAFQRPLVYQTPLAADLPDEAPPLITRNSGENNNPNLGTFFATTGGKIFSAEGGFIVPFRQVDGFWRKGDPFRSSWNPVTTINMAASGGLLFVTGRADSNGNSGRIVEIFKTSPKLQLETTITAPEGVETFGNHIAAAGDLLVIANQPDFFDPSRKVWIYRRNEAEGRWDFVNELQLSADRSSGFSIDTDGEKIVLQTRAANSGDLVVVYGADVNGDFVEEFRTGILQASGPFQGSNIISIFDIAIDQGIIAVSSNARSRLNHLGALLVLEQSGDTWERLPDLTYADATMGMALDIHNGSIYAAAGNGVVRFDASATRNQRPQFESEIVFQAVENRPYESEIILSDDTDGLTISALQLPAWLSLTTENDRTLLSGDFDIGDTDRTIRLKLTDREGVSAYQTAFIQAVPASSFPVITNLPEEVNLAEGQTLRFKPSIAGTGPFSYQWYLDGTALAGETSRTLSRVSITDADAGTYTLVATNIVDSTTSSAITLGVRPANRFAGDWPTLGGSASHFGHHPASLGTHKFLPAWSVEAYPNITSHQVAIADGKIFTVPQIRFSGEQSVKAFSLSDGAELWASPFEDANSMNPPTFHNGRVYFQRGNHSGDTQLWALDADDGSVIWEAPFRAQWERYAAPAVNDDGIWINGGSYGGMYGFNHDGSEKFFQNLAQVDRWTPTLQDGSLYSWVYGTFRSHDPETGQTAWSITPADPNGNNERATGISVVTPEEALVRNSNGTLTCLDLESRVPRWTTELNNSSTNEGRYFNNMPATNGKLVFASTQSVVDGLDLATGEEVMTFEPAQNITSIQPLIVNDHLFISSEIETYVYSLTSGDLVQTLPAGGALSYSEGYLVITENGGQMQAFFANDIPDITLESLPDMIEEVPYSVALGIVHDDSDEELSMTLRNAPDFLSLSDEGVLTGLFETDAAITEHTFDVEVSDGVNAPVVRQFTLNLVNVNDKPRIEPFEFNLAEDAPAFSIPRSEVLFDEEDSAEDLLAIVSHAIPQEDRIASISVSDGTFTVTPFPDRFGDFEVSLVVRDSSEERALYSIPISITPVADAPRIDTVLEDQATDEVGANLSISLLQAFLDPDPGEELTFTMTGNSNPAIFSNAAMENDVLELQFARYQSGSSNLTITATDPGGLTSSQTFTVVLPALPDPVITPDAAISFNRRTGLYEQQVTVTNSAARAIGGFDLTVTGLKNGYQLHGWSGLTVAHSQPLAAGETVTLNLEYHSPSSRELPTPGFEATTNLPDAKEVVVPGGIEPDRLIMMADRSMILEFASMPGRNYQVQYSHDMETWHNSPVIITAAANRTRWLDQGLPKTNCHPKDCPVRIYRVIEMAAAVGE